VHSRGKGQAGGNWGVQTAVQCLVGLAAGKLILFSSRHILTNMSAHGHVGLFACHLQPGDKAHITGGWGTSWRVQGGERSLLDCH